LNRKIAYYTQVRYTYTSVYKRQTQFVYVYRSSTQAQYTVYSIKFPSIIGTEDATIQCKYWLPQCFIPDFTLKFTVIHVLKRKNSTGIGIIYVVFSYRNKVRNGLVMMRGRCTPPNSPIFKCFWYCFWRSKWLCCQECGPLMGSGVSGSINTSSIHHPSPRIGGVQFSEGRSITSAWRLNAVFQGIPVGCWRREGLCPYLSSFIFVIAFSTSIHLRRFKTSPVAQMSKRWTRTSCCSVARGRNEQVIIFLMVVLPLNDFGGKAAQLRLP
jgi:hypothetical protein